MSKIPLNFLARSDNERQWIMENTWCDECGEADLGMDSPQEYKDRGKIYVEGNCLRCGGVVRSEICEKDSS